MDTSLSKILLPALALLSAYPLQGTASISFPEGVYLNYTVPEGAEFGLFYKKGEVHYIPFEQIEPYEVTSSAGATTYSYIVGKNQTISYRLEMPGKITRGDIINRSHLEDIDFTALDLDEHSDRYFNHDAKLYGGTNYADIFLNINRAGHLMLKQDSTFQIVNLRTWQITNSSTANYFLEPNYHYTVLNTDFKPDSSVVSVSSSGIITARKPGTAIVQVRYNAIHVGAAIGGNLWSEIWAENTGTFVVTVGNDHASDMNLHIHPTYREEDIIDSEHDIMYYREEAPGYRLTFKPEGVERVYVANPSVDTSKNSVSYPSGFSTENVTLNNDGSYTVLLSAGRNIIKGVDTAGHEVYQVLSAKPFSHSFTNLSGRDDDLYLPGDSVTVKIGGLYHIAGKLAGVYNHSCYMVFNDIANGDQLTGTSSQYGFAGGDAAQQWGCRMPTDTASEFVLRDGCLKLYGYGSAPGAHRGITYTNGIGPNFNAPIQKAYYGSIEQLSVPVTPIKSGMRLRANVNIGESITPLSLEALRHAAGGEVFLSLSDSSVVALENGGNIIGLTEGTATLTASNADSTFIITIDITCHHVAVEGLRFENDYIIKKQSENSSSSTLLKLVWTPENPTNKKVTWHNSNPEVASFDETTCRVSTKGSRGGVTTITATSEEGSIKASCTVEVRINPSGIAINPSEVSVPVGQSVTLLADVTPEFAYDKSVTWSSSDESVASVDTDGVVMGISEGTALITATSSMLTSRKATCTVTVSSSNALETVGFDDDLPVKWYNLQGFEVAAPDHGTHGIFIRVQNGISRKIKL